MSCGLLLAPICLVTTSENDLFSDIYESIFDWNFVLGFFHFVRTVCKIGGMIFVCAYFISFTISYNIFERKFVSNE